MQVRPYVFFDGRCEEAIEFYRQALDAELLTLMRHSDSPDPAPPGVIPPGAENKVMHATLQIGDSMVHVSDGQCGGKPLFEGVSLSITLSSVEECERRFAALAKGGAGEHAAHQDVFLGALRHVGRPIRRALDAVRRAVTSTR